VGDRERGEREARRRETAMDGREDERAGRA